MLKIVFKKLKTFFAIMSSIIHRGLTVVTALQDIDGQVTDSQAAAVPHYC
jgi:hypothetical protein